MDVYEAVASRLSMLGYSAAEADKPALEYLIAKCYGELLADINRKEVPEGLFYTLADMAAGSFLRDKLASGGLEIEGLDFSTATKSITEGDVSVAFAGAGDGASSPEGRFLAALDGMAKPPESTLSAFRRLRW